MIIEKPCDVHTEQIKQHETRLAKIDTVLEKVRNRPPVWVTLLMGALLAIIGWLTNAVKGS